MQARRKRQSIVRSAGSLAASACGDNRARLQTLAAKEAGGHVGHFLAVLHAFVEALHLRRGQRARQLLQRVLGGIGQLAANQRGRPIWRKETAVVFEKDIIELFQIAVGGVGVGDIELVVAQRLVGKGMFQTDWPGRQVIGAGQAFPAIGPIEELIAETEAQLGVLGQVADAFDVQALGLGATDRQGIRIAEAENIEQVQIISGLEQVAHPRVRGALGEP